jgi:hypothetical protein
MFLYSYEYQTGPGAHPASYLMSTEGKADHSPPSNVKVDVYLHSPTCLHGVMLN